VVWVLLAARAEIVRAVGTSDSISCHVFGRLARHCFTGIILCCIIWLRGIEGEYFLTVWALNNVIRVAHHDLRLLLANILKPFMPERLPQVVGLYHGVALAASTFCEVSRRHLGQQLLLSVDPEAFDVELMEAALSQKHLHFSCCLVSIRDFRHAVDAKISLKGAHIEVILGMFFLLFHRKVVCRLRTCVYLLLDGLGLHHLWRRLLLRHRRWWLLESRPCRHTSISLGLHDILLLACQVFLDVRTETCK